MVEDHMNVRCQLRQGLRVAHEADAAAATNVLIVDDEEPVRSSSSACLREAGYKTALAADGPEAIEVADEDGFARHPGDRRDDAGDDRRRARAAAARPQPRLKVLYLTGFSDRLFKEKVTLWEDEAFLDKPCSIKACCRRCRSCCSAGSKHHSTSRRKGCTADAEVRIARVVSSSLRREPRPTWLYDGDAPVPRRQPRGHRRLRLPARRVPAR